MDAFEHCRRLIAEADKERYWASLYAPADRRGALYALYAFNHEIARIAKVVREPMAGEIRLQWWREMLEGRRGEEATANPVAAAFLDVVRKHNLPVGRLTALIDARAADLYDGPDNIEDYGAATAGTIVTLAAQILGGEGIEAEHIARHAGLARTFAAARRPDDARRHLDGARKLLPQVPSEILPALLPSAVIGPSLGRDAPLPLWRRQWLIWRAARDPRRIFG